MFQEKKVFINERGNLDVLSQHSHLLQFFNRLGPRAYNMYKREST